MTFDPDRVRYFIEEQVPIHKLLNLQVLELSEGYAKVRVPFQDLVLGDIVRRRWHGGILATIMDSVGSLTGAAYFTSKDDKMATVDLRVDYLKGAEAKDIIVEGKIVRLGNRLLVTSMYTWDETETELLAEGKAVYNFIRLNRDES